MTQLLTGLVLAIGFGALSLVLRRGFNATSRGLTECSVGFSALLAGVSQLPSSNPAGTPPELLERLESVERRTDLALADLNVQLRRLGQRRRQLLDQEEPELDQEQLELAAALKSGRSSSPPEPQENGRPRLARRR